MKGTKAKILRAARLLFNTRGVANVSQRNISDHIAISPGNLTYHFKKRDDIIEALYFELAEEIEVVFERLQKAEVSFEAIHNLTKEVNKNLFEYRFFMIDFIHVLRSNPKIKKHYEALSAKRMEHLTGMIQNFVDGGMIREEELPKEYEYLLLRTQIFSDFWIASLGTTKEEVMLKHTRIYTEMFLQSLYPYLTVKGKKAFKKELGYI